MIPIARPGAAAAVLVACAASVGCQPSVNTVQVTVDAYISAVSLGDTARTMVLSARYQRDLLHTPAQDVPALQKHYRDLIESGYMLWDRAKATGEIELDELGISLIRAIGLGKQGGVAIPLRTRFEQDNMRSIVTTRAMTNYERIHWARIPTGGRMYLLGVPFGKVINFATGYDDPSQFKLLDTVDLEWSLERISAAGSPPGVPGHWYIDAIKVLPDTATSWSPPAVTTR
ncbi:MAG: hypothetical protein ACE5HU_08745 [Acidobacteriota bacterium]